MTLPQQIRPHAFTLTSERLRLRPLTEDDWGVLLRWNKDPEVLYFVEADDVTSRTLDELQAIYRGVSANAFLFMAELDGVPIGEGWLQKMNVRRVIDRYPGLDLRRIDLMIGEKALWGQGWGSRMIALLTAFGFEQCGADAIFGLVEDYNPRSRKAFEKNGYVLDNMLAEGPGRKGKFTDVLKITKQTFSARQSENP